MKIVKLLQREERKLLAVRDKIGNRLSSLRAAINALAGKNGPRSGMKSKLYGRKLSAAHRRAIKAGWAKRKKATA